MVRTNTLTVYPNGRVELTKNPIISTENYASTLVVDYFNVPELSTYYKWVDFIMEDGSRLTLPRVGEYTVSQLLNIDITNELTREGLIIIQPYATKDVDGVTHKVIFKDIRKPVEYFTNNTGDTATEQQDLVADLMTVYGELREEVDILNFNTDHSSSKMELDGSNSNVETLQWNTGIVPDNALLSGQQRWNSDKGTLEVGLNDGDIVGTMFEEVYYPLVINAESTAILNGQVVRFDGSLGNSGKVKVRRAVADGTYPEGYIMGIATQDITAGGSGRVTWFGQVNGIQTNGANYGETWTDGTILYAHPTIAGGLTNVEPTAPAQHVMVAAVINAHVSNGALMVRITSIPDSLQRLIEPKWNDVTFPLTRTYINPPTSRPDYDATNLGLLFPQNIPSEAIDIIIQVPHTWKEGTTIYPHVHVVQSASPQARFRMTYKWYNVGDEVPATWETYDMNTYALPYTGTNMAQVIRGAGGIDGTGKLISSMLKLKLARVDNTYVGDILTDQFDIHMLMDSFGSEEQFDKE